MIRKIKTLMYSRSNKMEQYIHLNHQIALENKIDIAIYLEMILSFNYMSKNTLRCRLYREILPNSE